MEAIMHRAPLQLLIRWRRRMQHKWLVLYITTYILRKHKKAAICGQYADTIFKTFIQESLIRDPIILTACILRLMNWITLYSLHYRYCVRMRVIRDILGETNWHPIRSKASWDQGRRSNGLAVRVLTHRQTYRKTALILWPWLLMREVIRIQILEVIQFEGR